MIDQTLLQISHHSHFVTCALLLHVDVLRKKRDLFVIAYEEKLWIKTYMHLLYMCCVVQEKSILLPPQKGFFLRAHPPPPPPPPPPPHPSGNANLKASYISLQFLAFEAPPPACNTYHILTCPSDDVADSPYSNTPSLSIFSKLSMHRFRVPTKLSWRYFTELIKPSATELLILARTSS